MPAPNPKSISTSSFDYPLPDDRIARHPLDDRDHSKLLCHIQGALSEHHFFDLPSLLPAGTMLVFNNTKVIHARLRFQKTTGSIIEIFCLEPYRQPLSQAFEQRSHASWLCFVGNNKRWREGDLSGQCLVNNQPCTLSATRRSAVDNAWIVDFHWSGNFSFAEVIEAAGIIPLPPYLHRDADAFDATRYQTVYALHEGSVAAPTAGLHFTPTLLDTLRTKGFPTEYLTLHVGAGTFKPVSSNTIGDHVMHSESIFASADIIQHIIDHQGHPLVAVGTTSVRTLESLYWFGVQLANQPNLDSMHVLQWDPYTLDDHALPASVALSNILQWLHRRGEHHLSGTTQLLIAPGYRYRVVNGLITNFHQPKSTLLLLVAALIGDQWRDCYRYALDHDFRFLSYGDSCLFLP